MGTDSGVQTKEVRSTLENNTPLKSPYGTSKQYIYNTPSKKRRWRTITVGLWNVRGMNDIRKK